MRKLLIILILGLLPLYSSAQDIVQDESYNYYLDLTSVQNDKLTVELITPIINQESIVLYFPKVIPGTYRIADFGRFISDVKAFTKDGTELTVENIETNGWQINGADKLYKVTYKVDDTFDAKITENPIFKMGGTNINDNEVFLINTHGVFGYFEGMKDKEFEVEIIHPSGFYGSTGMTASDNETGKDIFITESYNRLVDSPILYTRPDTTFIEVGGAKVLVSVYSPGKMVSSKYMAENFKELLLAQKEYLGGALPVDKYAFIMYFQDMSKVRDDGGLGAFAFGALEHSYSSVYYMPDAPEADLISGLLRIAAHEFFHIVTPLNIHSEEIQYFDFNQPRMSEHLWLYEGVIEYFAHHVQVKYGIKSTDQFLNAMSEKITNSLTRFDDRLPFTEMSKGSLEKYQDEFLNVYEKGALIGMLLDIKLLSLSNGRYGLNDLILDLSEKYGKDKPFKDEELFGVITSMTYPEIGEFLNRYVAGNDPLPLKETLALAGVDYKTSETYKDFTLGEVGLNYNPETNTLYVASTEGMNKFGKELGYKVGDELYSVNGLLLEENMAPDIFEKMLATFKENETAKIVVMRKNAAGVKERVTLTAEAIKVEKKRVNPLKLIKDPTPEQLAVRNSWLGK